MINKKFTTIFIIATVFLLALSVVSAADNDDSSQSTISDTSTSQSVDTTSHSSVDTSTSQSVDTSSHSSVDTTQKSSDTSSLKSSDTTSKASDTTQKSSDATNSKSVDVTSSKSVDTSKTSTNTQLSSSDNTDVAKATQDSKNSSDVISTNSVTTSVTDQKNSNSLKTDQVEQTTSYDVNDYDELVNTIDYIKSSGDQTTYTINLANSTSEYIITQDITWGDSEVANELIINGNGVTINGNDENFFLTIERGYTLTLNDITIANCYSDDNGVIYNTGNLTITNCSFTENNANDGGAIASSGNLVIIDSEFTDNTADEHGGAIFNTINLEIINSVFDGNAATKQGGAIANRGTMIIEDSSFSDNFGTTGGGAILNLYGTVEITNTDFTDNVAENVGGAVYNDRGVMTIKDSYFEDNTAIETGLSIQNAGELTVTGSTFDESVNVGIPGIIFNYYSTVYYTSLEIEDCDFILTIREPLGDITIYSPIIDQKVDSDEEVTFFIDSQEVTVKPDQDGVFSTVYDFSEDGEIIPMQYANDYQDSSFEIDLQSVIPTVITVDDVIDAVINDVTTVKGVLTDIDGNPLSDQVIYVGVKTPLSFAASLVATEEDGSFELEVILSDVWDGYYVNVTYWGDENYANSSYISPLFSTRYGTTTEVEDVTINYNDPITFTATVTDNRGYPVNEGQVAFKINGVMHKDDEGNIIYVDVDSNGVATLTFDSTYSPKNYTIQALYYGTEKYYYSSKSDVGQITVLTNEANIQVTTLTDDIKAGDNVIYTAIVTDENGNLVESGDVVFKINSVTIKDEDGNPKKVSVVDGVATLVDTIPVDTAGKDYTLTAVYSGSHYDRVETNTTLTVIRSNVTAVLDPVYITQGENATVKVTLYDQNGNQLERDTKTAVKVNGKTFANENTTNGVLEVTLDTADFKNSYYNLTVVLGENSAYNELRLNSVIIVDPIDESEDAVNTLDSKDLLKTSTYDEDSNTYIVNDYDELIEVIETIKTSGDQTSYTINLTDSGSSYIITEQIVWANSLVTKELVINGNGVTIDGSNENQFIIVNPDYVLTLNDVTVINCYGSVGGAIVVGGNLTINNSTFSDNSASSGGVVYNLGSLIVIDSTFSYNSAVYGGAISNYNNTALTNSLFSYNSASQFGGAIYNMADLTISSTVFEDNIASNQGGAIISNGTIDIVDSSFSGGNASNGGSAILNMMGTVNVANSNFTNNYAETVGGAVYNNRGVINIRDSKFANNTADQTGLSIQNAGEMTITGSTFNDIVNNGTAGSVFNYYSSQYDTSLLIEDCDFSLTIRAPLGEDVTIFSPIVDQTINPEEEATFTIGDDKITVTPTDGVYSTLYQFEDAGVYSVELEYADLYEDCEFTINVDVLMPTIITVEDVTNAVIGEPIPVVGKLTDVDGNPLANQEVQVRIGVYNGNYVDFTVITDEYGVFNTSMVFIQSIGQDYITVTYLGNDEYAASNVTSSDFYPVFATFTEIEDVTINYGDSVTFTATVTDFLDRAVHLGQVAFKVNGVMLKDDEGNIIYVDVDNEGVATLTFDSTYSPKNYTIEALYYGSDGILHTSKSDVGQLTVLANEANIQVTTLTDDIKAGDNVIFTAIVTDDNGLLVENGDVAFKLNGVTLKDKEGNSIKVSVVDGVATLDYTIPVDMAAKDYVLTAVYSGSHYDRVETNTTLTVIRSNVTAVLEPVYITQGENATIKVTLYDQNGNQLERDTKTAVKVNGKTFANVNTTNGVLEVTLDTADFKNSYYNLTVVLGENSAYNELRLNSVIIVDPVDEKEEAVNTLSIDSKDLLKSSTYDEESNTYIVSDYEELFDVIETIKTSGDQTSYTINLTDSGSSYIITDGIVWGNSLVAKELVINGNGVTIDGSDENQFIIVYPDYVLTLNDVTVINCYNDYAGAILVGGNLTINNSTFSDNSASYGGAIFNQGNLTINDSTFSDNSASYGGVVYNLGSLIVSDSIFSDNSAVYGGAIGNYGNNTALINSLFSDNSASQYGGAIYNMADLTISSTVFEDNIASNQGGAIISNGTIDIVDSSFTGGNASNGGAAIMNMYGTVNIANSNFTENTVRTVGGAVYNNRGVMNIKDSKFANNTALQTGLSIQNAGEMTITGSTFNDFVDSGTTGSVFNYYSTVYDTSLVIEECDFNFTIRAPLGEDVTIFSPLIDQTIDPDQEATFIIGSDKITVTPTDGLFSTVYTFEDAGVYSVEVDYTDLYQDSNFTINVNMLKPTIITVEDVTDAVVGEYIPIVGKLTDSEGNPLANQEVEVRIEFLHHGYDSDIITTDENGEFSTSMELMEPYLVATYITVLYYGDEEYASSTATSSYFYPVYATFTEIEDVTINYGDSVTFTATVTDILNRTVHLGQVAFKVNGVMLKDDEGNIIYVDVDNEGVATLTFDSTYSPKNYTIEALYYGSEGALHTSKSDVGQLTVLANEANIQVTTLTDDIKAGDNVIYTAIVTDENGALVENGDVVFKLNGVTIKDEEGNPIKVAVVNGVATLDYTIPVDMAAKDYELTAVFSGSYYDRVETNTTISLIRSNVTAVLEPVYITQGENTTVKVTLYDQNGNQLERDTKTAVKVNGKTFANENTTSGVLEVTLDTSDFKNSYYNLTVVLGENSAYNELRLNSVIIVDPIDESEDAVNTLDSKDLLKTSTYDEDSNTYIVNDYDELFDVIETIKTSGDQTSYTINLTDSGSPYIITEEIMWANSDVTKELVINCNGVTIDGSNENQFIIVYPDYVLTLNDVTVINCYGSVGGAIVVGGNLTINNSTFSGNRASYGGAIFNQGNLTINDSTFSDNSAAYGGAISNYNNTALTNSLFSNNSASQHGGAIYNMADLTISSTVFEDNTASNQGGAIISSGNIDIVDSSFTGGNASRGGAAIMNMYGTVNIANSNFTKNNVGTAGGAVYNNRGVMNIKDSKFANNSADQTGLSIQNAGEMTITGSTFNDIVNNGTVGSVFNYYSTVYDTSLVIGDCDFNLTIRAPLSEDVTIFSPIVDQTINPEEEATFTIGDDKITVIPTDGVYSTLYQFEDAGVYSVELEYADLYEDCEFTINVDVLMPTIITVEDVTNAVIGEPIPVVGKLTDVDGNPLANQEVQVRLGLNHDDYVDFTVITDEDGVFNTSMVFIKYIGQDYITVTYPGNDEYAASTATTAFFDTIFATFTEIEDVTINYGDSVTFTATVTDILNRTVHLGQVAFKVNGVMHKDSDGNIIYVDVNNEGVATLTFDSTYTPKNYTIEALYYGSEGVLHTSKSGVGQLTVLANEANIQVTTLTDDIKAGDNVIFTAIVTDENGALVENSDVVFKLNGVTIKDEEGNPIKVAVVNGVATLNYTIPVDMAAKDYELTAVFSGSYYDRVETNTTISLIRSNVTAVLEPVYITQGENTTIKVTLYDQNGNQLERDTKTAVKVNSKTFANVNTTGGVLEVTLDTADFKNPYYNLTVVLGENSAYNELRLNSVIIVDPIDVSEEAVNTLSIDSKDLLKSSTYDEESNTYIVNDYDELFDVVETIKTSGDQTSYTINLTDSGNPYIITEEIIWANSLVTKELVINGNGVTIDGSNETQFINVSDDFTLTLNDITVINCYSDDGGAIAVEGNLTINNSEFSNNSASYGGVIYNKGNLTVIDSEFSANSASYGGIIYNNVNLTVIDSEFSQNSAALGGVIVNQGNTSLIDSYFSLNYGRQHGGVVYNMADLIVTGSEFEDNLATYQGGAIISNGTVDITDSSFSGGDASRGGGAILNMYGTINIANSNFTENTVRTAGGAIYNNRGVMNIKDSKFVNNTADQTGLSIQNAGEMTITGSTFNDSVDSGTAGSVYNYYSTQYDTSLVIEDCDFSLTIRAPIGEEVTLFSPIIDQTIDPDEEVTFTIDDDKVTVTPNDGLFSTVYKFDDAGVYSVEMEYATLYQDSSFTIDVNMLKPTIITVEDVTNAVIGEPILVTGKLTDSEGNPLANQDIEVREEILNVRYYADIVTTDENGEFTTYMDLFPNMGTYFITVIYYGDDEYAASTANSSYFYPVYATFTEIEDVTINYGDSVTFTATVTDILNRAVHEGQVAFKVNGVMLKDDEGNIVYVDVDNEGVATLTFDSTYSPKNYTIEALYYGSEGVLHTSKSDVGQLTVLANEANIQVTTLTDDIKAGDNVIFTAIVSDDNGVLVESGDVVFKLNGVTIKDEEGNPIKVAVVNGVATLNYTIPVDMAAKDYELTAVYSGSHYDRVETNTTLTVIRSNVTAVLDPVYITQGENATIKVTLYDQNGNQLERDTKTAVKVNGKTFANVNTTSGVLEVTLDTADFKNSYYNLTVVLGENSAYNELRLNSVIIVDPIDESEDAVNTLDSKDLLKTSTYDEESNTYIVNDYDELVEVIEIIKTSGDQTSYTINLTDSGSPYIITQYILWYNPDVTKELVINGNGVTIDGLNENNFITVYEDVLTLNNITVINCYNDDAGVIYNEGNLTIINSTFSDNSASYGGVINNEGNLTVIDSEFTENSAAYGGVIYNGANANLINSLFSDNSASQHGGAIYNTADLTVTGSVFEDDIATGQGGAIVSNGNVDITDCSFDGCNATTSGGGAILNMMGTLSITNSNFTNNYAFTTGGAVYNNRGVMNIKDSKFDNNTASNTGLSVQNAGEMTITSSSFNDTVSNGTAGSVFNYYSTVYDTSLVIEDCDFNLTIRAPLGEDVTIFSPIVDQTINPEEEATFTIGDDKITVTPTDGVYSTLYQFEDVGFYSVELEYADLYEDCEFTINVDVLMPTIITVEDVTNAIIGEPIPVVGKLTDADGNPLANQEVQVRLGQNHDDYIDFTVITDENGVFNTSMVFIQSIGQDYITVTYPGNDEYAASTATTAFFDTIFATFTEIEDVTINYGDSVTFTATVTDILNRTVHLGQVAFKVNGVMHKDSDGNIIYVDVNNEGVATLTFDSTYTPKNYTIEALYYGSEGVLHTSKSDVGQLTVLANEANIQVTTLTDDIKAGDNVIFTAIVTDENGVLVENGDVVFKLNGVTLKDEEGNPIKVAVVNGVATLNYTIPVDMAAKNYVLTAVYSGSYYDRVETNTTLTVIRSNVTAVLEPVYITQGENATIKVTLYDQNGNQLERDTKTAVKVNGKTFANINTTNGVLEVTLDTADFKNSYYNLTVVLGENSAYNELRLNSVIIVDTVVDSTEVSTEPTMVTTDIVGLDVSDSDNSTMIETE